MKNLEILDLSRNQLSSAIPIDLRSLNFLNVLDLSSNNFSGKIPLGTQLQTFNASVYAGNDKLCGLLLPLCPEDESTSFPPPNDHCKDEDTFVTTGFYVSVVLGFAIGFWTNGFQGANACSQVHNDVQVGAIIREATLFMTYFFLDEYSHVSLFGIELSAAAFSLCGAVMIKQSPPRMLPSIHSLRRSTLQLLRAHAHAHHGPRTRSEGPVQLHTLQPCHAYARA
ncbi:hypothetical protein LguiA_002957 [Lonicera macranthoides]